LKKIYSKISLIILLLAATPTLIFAQSSTGMSSFFVPALVVAVVLIGLGAVLTVADNTLKLQAQNLGADKTEEKFGVWPTMDQIFKPKVAEHAKGHKVNILKKGHDILLQGTASKTIDDSLKAKTFAVKPTDFRGLSPIPKVAVEIGDEVKAGDVLFFDKQNTATKFVSPVSGEVIAVNRGEKRRITEIVILADKEISFKSLSAPDLSGDRQTVVDFLLESGGWSHIVQRPYGIVPDVADVPRDIYISTFDTAPLAPDLSFIISGQEVAFQKGLDVLGALTEGSVHLGIDARVGAAPASAFTNASGVEKHFFSGSHPAGNVGVQIHNINAIAPSHKVWTLNIQSVVTLGKLWTEGKYDASKLVAVTGAEINKNAYVKTYQGASIEQIVAGNVNSDITARYISGDVLSGSQIEEKGYLNFHDDQLTVIKEGNEYEMFGWLLPLSPRPTISKTYPNFLFPDYEFQAETNMHGEKRAFVVTGQYESVLPMDIHLGYLMKNIVINDYEMMEGLGIHELEEEDVALAEFTCTSKQPLQSILREGLDYMRSQG